MVPSDRSLVGARELLWYSAEKIECFAEDIQAQDGIIGESGEALFGSQTKHCVPPLDTRALFWVDM